MPSLHQRVKELARNVQELRLEERQEPPLQADAERPRLQVRISRDADPPAEVELQRLTVEEALSYLDDVKATYADQPQIYNQFLDIMKDFKQKKLDTPGVIVSVSHLFNENPRLIAAFRVFLPPGYQIHVKKIDDDEPIR